MLCERGFSDSGRQKFGMLLSQSVQSCLRTEKDRINAAMAIVDGANSIDVVSEIEVSLVLISERCDVRLLGC